MAVLKEQGGYLIPSLGVFLIFCLISVVTMIILIAGKKAVFPGWMWILNPLTFKILINIVGRLGSGAAANGIACSNMILGAIIIFLAWRLHLRTDNG